MKAATLLLAPLANAVVTTPALESVNSWPGGDQLRFNSTGILGDGTCTVSIPHDFTYFHVFNAHVRPNSGDPSIFGLVAANTDMTQGFITFDIRWDDDELEVDAVTEVFVACDDEAAWDYAIYSFPAGVGNTFANSNIRKFGGNVDGDLTMTFPQAVADFAALGNYNFTMGAGNTTATFSGVDALQVDFRMDFDGDHFHANEMTIP